jgi:malate dehydrogenase (oxaloacetate-decarboxylating)(NADP+)
MKVAATRALAELAKEDVPDEVAAAYHGRRLRFGPDYIIPTPFDPRLITHIPPFVAQAAMNTGVARKPIEDMDAYKQRLAQRLDPTAAMMQRVQSAVRRAPKRIVFAEGEEPSVIRAAYAFQEGGLGQAILIGREETVRANMATVGLPENTPLRIVNARLSEQNGAYTDFVYKRLQRFGFLHRDAQRLVNQDRNVFGACLVAFDHADGMVTGVTRSYATALDDVLKVIDAARGERPMGASVVLFRGRTLFISDTAVAEFPDPPELAQIVIQSAALARQFGATPRVALISHSTFGNPKMERSEKIRAAVSILDRREDVPFEYEGEMNVDVALNPNMRELYPFSRLSEPANVLVMPALHSSSIATSLLMTAGGATVIGPVLTGLAKPIQIAPLGGTVSDIVTYATLAAFQASEQEGAARSA